MKIILQRYKLNKIHFDEIKYEKLLSRLILTLLSLPPTNDSHS